MKRQPHAFARTDQTRLGVWWWTTDHLLLGVVTVLMMLGVLLSFASSPAAAARLNLTDPFHFATRQCLFAAVAAVILIGVSMLSPRGIKRSAFFIYAAAIGVMAILPLLGHNAKGATRWLEFGGFSLQPSEFMKPALIVLVAWMFSEGQKGEGVPGVSIAFGLYGVAVALLLIQPDVGQTILITIAFGAAFFVAGVPMRWIFGLFGAALVGLVGVYFTFGHVSTRVHKFLSPDASGARQIDSAQEAIAAGGLFGRGPGEGVMKRHVPDLHTDFIYSVAAEEYGLMFSLMLIALFGVLVTRGLYKAMKLSNPFEQIAAAGLFVLVGQQAFINVAVNLNLIPTKGMTLPFISYGGSSMMAMGLTLGMALALTRRRPGAYAAPDGLAKAGAYA
ncbi:MAG TPA: putative lipid II flippase FtsW [Caulobacteraceae bacterium]|nr:putative lipid II flippase FtsW [Caulobacteraceae bacterium]